MTAPRLYPTVPRARARTIALDVATVVALLVFAWAGMKVHDGVAELSSLGRGLQDAGGAVQQTGRDVGGAIDSAFGSAGGAVGGAPLVGGTLEGALRDAGSSAGGAITRAGEGPGGDVVAAGRDGERKAYALANLLGWATFLLPAALLLFRVGPPRVRNALGWTAADRVFAAGGGRSIAGTPRAATDDAAPTARLSDESPTVRLPGGGDSGRAAVLAQRAVVSLPYRDLLRHSADPVGDLLAGRHESLLAALAEHDGVDARPRLG